jgi:hypothetical protein
MISRTQIIRDILEKKYSFAQISESCGVEEKKIRIALKNPRIYDVYVKHLINNAISSIESQKKEKILKFITCGICDDYVESFLENCRLKEVSSSKFVFFDDVEKKTFTVMFDSFMETSYSNNSVSFFIDGSIAVHFLKGLKIVNLINNFYKNKLGKIYTNGLY